MATPIRLPRLSKVATTGEILEWLVQPGSYVAAGEPLLRVLSEKATVDVEAPASGTLLQILAQPGQEVPLGSLLGWIGQEGEVIDETVPERPPTMTKGASPSPVSPRMVERSAGVIASPSARRAASQLGVDLAGITGSGPGGIIGLADIRQTAEVRRVPELGVSPRYPPPPAGVTLTPVTGIQKIMLERMEENVRSVAQTTTVAEIDMDRIVRLREEIEATYTAWAILAAARALHDFPILNASLYEGGIVYHAGVHMGVSVETEAGLVVPVMHHAQELSLAQVQRELQGLVEAARQGRLPADKATGATFTVTNSGVLGSVLYTPMIVPPQSAILGLGRLARVPVVAEDDRIVAGWRMYLCLSYDHRFIAGGTAVRYLQKVRGYLEEPIPLIWNAGR